MNLRLSYRRFPLAGPAEHYSTWYFVDFGNNRRRPAICVISHREMMIVPFVVSSSSRWLRCRISYSVRVVKDRVRVVVRLNYFLVSILFLGWLRIDSAMVSDILGF